MARNLRFVPPGSLVEVTTRTVQGRFLLRPSRDLTAVTLGILARAAQRYSVGVCAFAFLSNHSHLLLRPTDAQQLALFMGYLNGNLAKEAGRLHEWRERFWGRRYACIVISDEEAAQVARLRYVLEQGCKEGLVRSPRDWPGATSVGALLSGEELRGLWFDRTKEFDARRREERPGKYEYAQDESFRLVPLPCWEDEPEEATRRRVVDEVRAIERETRQRLQEQDHSVLGVKRILAQHPHDRPAQSKRSPAPRFHATSRVARQSLELAYYEFRRAFRQAACAFRLTGDGEAFPIGSFPPRLPFVAGRVEAAAVPP